MAARLYFAGVRVQDLRRTPVPELQRLYVDECRDLPGGGLTALKSDPRAGARAIAEKIERRNHKAQAEGRRLWRLCAFELPLWEQGITLVGGCDEVGEDAIEGSAVHVALRVPPLGDSTPEGGVERLGDMIQRENSAGERRGQGALRAVQAGPGLAAGTGQARGEALAAARR